MKDGVREISNNEGTVMEVRENEGERRKRERKQRKRKKEREGREIGNNRKTNGKEIMKEQ